MSASEFVWQPSPDLIERANLTRLQRALGAGDYHELHRISIEEPDRFWPALIDDLGIEFSRRWDAVVDSSRGPEWSTWFVGGQVNLARVCVHRWASDEEAAMFSTSLMKLLKYAVESWSAASIRAGESALAASPARAKYDSRGSRTLRGWMS